MKSSNLFILLLAVSQVPAHGEKLAAYDSSNYYPSIDPLLHPSDWADGVQPPSPLLISPGLATDPAPTNLVYRGWDTTINPSKFIGFNVTAKPGYRLYVRGLSGFNTGGGRFAENALTSFVWGYRIDDDGDGVFEQDWTFTPTYLPSAGEAFLESGTIKGWDFVGSNCTTKGTIQFGVFASAATSAGSLRAFGNGLTVEGVAVPSSGPLSSLHYNASYNLDVSEASAVAWSRDTDTLFTLGDEGVELVEISKTGQRLSAMPFDRSGKSPTRPFEDPEGLCWLGGKKFVISDERRNQGVVVTYDPATKPTLADVTPTTYAFGPYDSNTGLEGVTYDPINDSLWGVRESGPVKIYEMHNYTSISQGGPVVVNEPLETRRIDQAGIYQLSDIYCLALSHYFAEGNPRRMNFLLLSRGGKRVVEVDRQGRVVDTLDLKFLGLATIEGITMDDAGTLYLVSEQAGSGQLPKLHVFSPTVPETVLTADRAQAYTNLEATLGKLGATPQLALKNADFSSAIDAVIAQGTAKVLADPAGYNLFTESSIQDLRGTGMLIRMTDDTTSLTLPLETSTDLNNWTDAGVKMEATLPKVADKAFYRLTIPAK